MPEAQLILVSLNFIISMIKKKKKQNLSLLNSIYKFYRKNSWGGGEVRREFVNLIIKIMNTKGTVLRDFKVHAKYLTAFAVYCFVSC